MSYSKSKKQRQRRKEQPRSWLEQESLAFVASPLAGVVATPVASQHNKELFLERLEKEMVTPFARQTRKRKRGSILPVPPPLTKEQKTLLHNVWNQRVVVGTNQCTRVLQRALTTRKDDAKNNQQQPTLIVLARDIYPPTVLSHIPVIVQQLASKSTEKCPILLLPGQASKELGHVFGTKNVSVMVFLSPPPTSSKSRSPEEQQLHDNTTSFVQFVKRGLL